MLGRHVGDQLLDQYRFADACATEQTDLTALGVGCQQVNHLNAGLQDLHHGALVGKAGRVTVNTPFFSLRQRLAVINDLTGHVKQTTQRALAHRHHYPAALGSHFHITAQPLAGGKHDAPHGVTAHVLGNLHHAGMPAVLYRQRIFDEGQMTLGEQNVHHRTLHLCNNPFHHDVFFLFCALAPPATSTICWVMAA